MVNNLPELPEEFVPKFEQDLDREMRLERRREAERERDEKALEFQPECWSRHRTLARLMREDLEARRNLDLPSQSAA